MRNQGYYFEEIQPGLHIRSTGRTITETDVVAFAGLSGDYNQIHTDEEYSRQSYFGRRVAHGLLILSVASGLAVRTGFVEETVIAFRDIVDWKFVKPVFIGDTVYVEIDVKDTKEIRRLGGGSVLIELQVKNQAGETVNKGLWTFLVASRPAQPNAPAGE